MGNCRVVLGSATPSLQSMFNANIGRFSLLEIKKRVNEMPMPEVRMVNLRAFDKNDPQTMISRVLEHAIKETLSRGRTGSSFHQQERSFCLFLCARHVVRLSNAGTVTFP